MSIFENMTYETLTQRVLSRVSPELDKREGSIIYNGTAPAMAELAQFYAALELMLKETYALTASREFLILRAKDIKMSPYPASPAVLRADFNLELPEGTRFSLEDLNFSVTGRLEDEDGEGIFAHLITCETPGEAANDYTGDLIPIEYIGGLTYAQIVSLAVPGEDEEDTEDFRQRYLDAIRGGYFGGNVKDYKNKLLSINGVKACKVYRVSNRDINPSALIPSERVCTEIEELLASGNISSDLSAWLTSIYTAARDKLLTVGGTVRCVILAENGIPSEEFLETIQNAIDPVAGEGLGLAPIGHVVNIEGVKKREITYTCFPVLNASADEDLVWEQINIIVDEYFSKLTNEWSDSDYTYISASQIDARILTKLDKYVADITGSKLNGELNSLRLERDEIPVRGD